MTSRILAVMSYSEYGVDQWSEAIANLHANTEHDPGDGRQAYEAIANVWSAYGYQDAPTEVIKMLVNACEIAYMAALDDLRDGDLDAQIQMWRPDLAEQWIAGNHERAPASVPARSSQDHL